MSNSNKLIVENKIDSYFINGEINDFEFPSTNTFYESLIITLLFIGLFLFSFSFVYLLEEITKANIVFFFLIYYLYVI